MDGKSAGIKVRKPIPNPDKLNALDQEVILIQSTKLSESLRTYVTTDEELTRRKVVASLTKSAHR